MGPRLSVTSLRAQCVVWGIRLPANHESTGCHDREPNRRIARELHDSTSRLLTDLQLHLQRLAQLQDSKAELLVHECQQAISEIRDQVRLLNLD